MIVFVKVSARRYLALSVPTIAAGWRSTGNSPDGGELGFEYQTSEIIAGPSDWTTVEVAAREYATAHHQLVSYEVHEQKRKQEIAMVDAAGAKLIAERRNVPAGYRHKP
jgi:hypothetical protein